MDKIFASGRKSLISELVRTSSEVHEQKIESSRTLFHTPSRTNEIKSLRAIMLSAKLKGDHMKHILAAAVALFALNASAEYVTATVCTFGESGTDCKEITYKVRPASAPQAQEEVCAYGEAAYGPCPTETGIPGWLQDLNLWAADHGLQAPANDDSYINP
jgi:hypothetical protein